MKDVMQRMTTLKMRDRMKAMQELTQSAMANPGGKLAKQKKGTGKRLTAKEKAKLKKEREREARRRRRKSRRTR
jgi:signal recognition particle subunit SRP54